MFLMTRYSTNAAKHFGDHYGDPYEKPFQKPLRDTTSRLVQEYQHACCNMNANITTSALAEPSEQ